MLQGVREIFELTDGVVDVGGEEVAGRGEGGKIVLIGRNIGNEESLAAFQASLNSAVSGK